MRHGNAEHSLRDDMLAAELSADPLLRRWPGPPGLLIMA